MIAPIEKTDCGRLAELHAKCFPRGWSAMEIASLITQPGSLALKAIDGEIGGFLLIRTVADEAEILTLAVDPAQQRKGLARDLVGHAETKLGQQGCARLFLEVSVRNTAALALYDALGFQKTGRRFRYYADGADAILMEKSFAQ